MDTTHSVAATDAPLTAPAEEPEAKAITVKEKWQGAVTEASGFVAIPMSLLRLQTNLKLNATDMLVMTNLLAHWWDPARAVFPRTSIIASRMGVDTRTIQRSVNKMIKLGLIERTYLEDGKRAFQFDGLATRLAKEMPNSLKIQGEEMRHRPVSAALL